MSFIMDLCTVNVHTKNTKVKVKQIAKQILSSHMDSSHSFSTCPVSVYAAVKVQGAPDRAWEMRLTVFMSS